MITGEGARSGIKKKPAQDSNLKMITEKRAISDT
jgi:hypothetical protein